MDERQRQTYGNGERYFYVIYGILTDERNSYVLLQRSTEIRLRTNGNVTLKTRCEPLCRLAPQLTDNSACLEHSGWVSNSFCSSLNGSTQQYTEQTKTRNSTNTDAYLFT